MHRKTCCQPAALVCLRGLRAHGLFVCTIPAEEHEEHLPRPEHAPTTGSITSQFTLSSSAIAVVVWTAPRRSLTRPFVL